MGFIEIERDQTLNLLKQLDINWDLNERKRFLKPEAKLQISKKRLSETITILF